MAVATDREIITLSDFSKGREKVVTEKLGALPPRYGYRFVKRAFDIAVSVLALVILLVPMLLTALIVALDAHANPIFSQVRLGKDGAPFTLLKFRTMRLDAEKDGAQWACSDDPRVTKVGRFLRNTRMDELPQLLNILVGQMSFVGPRPERPEFYDVFDTYIDGFRQRLLIKPGLTGHAQVNGGYELLPEEKIVYDLEYIKHCSIGFDIKCMIKTVAVIFTHDGVR